jgi:clan AA aspartic protease (TIGR02281 family)
LSLLAAADRVTGQRAYGGVLIVEARIGDLQVRLLVDTGCAVTALTPAAIDRIGLDRGIFRQRRVVFTAAGTTMAVPTGRIPGLRLGSVQLREVEVALLELAPGLRLDGLLGVNVLDRFRTTFEFRSATLVLRPERTR